MAQLKLDLQYFSQEKTEKATPKKRQDTRKKGQVAKSNDINTSISLLIIFLFLWLSGSHLFTMLTMFVESSLHTNLLVDVSQENIQMLFLTIAMEASKMIAPVMLVALVAGIFSNYIQVGVLFSSETIKPKLERINPLKGFKRIYSLRALVELLKSLLKIMFVSGVTFAVLWLDKEKLFAISNYSLLDSLAIIGSSIIKVGLSVSIVLLLLAILDYMYQRYDFEKNIRMSKQDIKDEYKKSEGDPLIKSKIKEKQRQMAMRRMMQEVPKADVVITNPTHFAIALKYNDQDMDAPVVIAKGMDYVALKIKEIAKSNEIITVENRALARSLYSSVEIGDIVPEQFFKAVAEILAYVYRVKGKV